MEYILILTPNNSLPKLMGPAVIELTKKLLDNPGEYVKGGKLLAGYSARTKMLNVFIWEAPSVDSFMPYLEQLVNMGWDTEIIPAEKMEVRLEKVTKAMAATGV